MKILTVINSTEAGGAQSLLCNWATLSNEKNSHILIVLQGSGFFSKHYEQIFDKVLYFNISLNPIDFFINILKIIRFCFNYKPDIVHTHLLQSDLVGLLLTFFNFKVVSTIHSSSTSAEKHRRSIILQKLIAKSSSKFLAVICSSLASKNFGISQGYDISKILEIHNATVSGSESMANKDERKYFLSLARWHPVKDHRTLLLGFQKHLKHYPDSKLILAGFEINKNNSELMFLLEKMDLQNSVDILDDAQDARPLIRSSIATVISSLSESISMVGIESLSESTPVITSKVGDYELISLDNSLIFDAGDSDGLAKAFNTLANMGNREYAALSIKAFTVFQNNFSSEAWVNQHLKLYADFTATQNE